VRAWIASTQLATLSGAAARIDHRYGVVSKNEADVGDRIFIRRRGILMHPVVHKDSCSNLDDARLCSFAAAR